MPRMSDPHKRMLFILGAVAALAIFSSTMSKNPALPLLAESIGADPAQVGLISAISPIPGILVSSIAGAYSDRVGRERLITASLLIFATAPFLYLFVTQTWQLGAIRFYHGFATAVFMPVASAAIADRYSADRRGEKLATFSSASMVGRFAAPFVGGSLIYFANFGFLYIVCAATGIAALVLAFVIPWKGAEIHATAKKFQGSTMEALRRVVKDSRIIITSSMEGVQYYAMGAFEAFLPLYMNSLHFNGLEIGAVMGVQVVSMLLAKPLMGRVSDQRGRSPSIFFGLVVGFVCIVLLPQVASLPLLLLLSVAFGVTVATVTASTSALVCEVAGGSAHGSAIGVLSSIMDIGHSIGPLATGIIVGAFVLPNYQLGFGVAGVLLLIGALVFAVGVWRRTPPLVNPECKAS
jgi:MFS family permease